MNYLSASAKVSRLADIETPVCGSKFLIDERSFIDLFVNIKFVGGSGDVIVGTNSHVNAGCVIYSGNGVSIGNDVLIAVNCNLAAVNHEYLNPCMLIRDQGFMPSRGGIVIENDVWIGAGVVLLDGARVREGSVVAAGSVVSGEVEAYSVVGGRPLRRIKDRAA